MNLKVELDNFEDVNFDDWVNLVEKQLGKPFSSLDYKSVNDINLQAIYNNSQTSFNLNKNTSTTLFNKDLLSSFDKVYYFSDFLKNGLNSITEIAFIVYSVLNEYNQNEKNILIISSIDTKFYDNIFKFRALRILLDKLSDKLSLDLNYKILSNISPINKSNLDVETNLIRQSSECVSAVISGVDYISTLSYKSDNLEFANRISDNIVRIIEDETFINSIYDSTKGAFFFEKGTDHFVTKAFGQIKKFNKMTVDEVNSYVSKSTLDNYKYRVDKLKNRSEKLIGVNIYSNPKDSINKINKDSISKYFEEFRIKSQNYKNINNIEPVIYLACFGDYSQIKSRIDFIEDFYNIGGFKCKISPVFETIEDAVSSIDINNCKYNILISTNELYPSIVPQLIIDLTKLNPEIKISVAGKLDNDEERFIELGVDRFIHLKSNIYDELQYVWELFENL